jgi:DnaJ-class molecular chaperone
MEEAIMSDYQEDDEEPTEADCKVCGGYGEFAANSYSTEWIECTACNGTGLELED